MFVAVGVPQSQDGFAEHQIRGSTQGHDLQRPAGVDFDEGDVFFAVEGDDLGLVRAAVVERAPHGIDAVDDVIVGGDVAPLIHDDAGAHAVDFAAF